jgi:hypothetical protein
MKKFSDGIRSTNSRRDSTLKIASFVSIMRIYVGVPRQQDFRIITHLANLEIVPYVIIKPPISKDQNHPDTLGTTQEFHGSKNSIPASPYDDYRNLLAEVHFGD